MPFYPPAATAPTFGHLLRSFALGGPDDDLLTQDDLDQAAQRHHVAFASQPGAVWTPALTLWALLGQCASAAKDCAAAVARALVWRLGLGLPPCSANTGAYCKARAKLPEPFLRDLCTTLAARCDEQAPDGWRWHGRDVQVIDGTVCTAADTDANQEAYPQRDNLPGGVGFPLLRLVALFSLASGAIRDAVCGPYSGKGCGETTLARSLVGRLQAGDVLLGDRLFGTYWLIAWVLDQGADGVFRLHAHRRRDGGTRASRLERTQGPRDNRVVWDRPKRPEWMDEATYAALPAQLRLRIVWQRLQVPGFRTQEVEIVTTLLDPVAYPVVELVALYRRRWEAELTLRSLKQGMKMAHLWCKTPAMLRQEIWGHLLAYNLVRAAMARAARACGERPQRLSFARSRSLLEAMGGLLAWSEGDFRALVVATAWQAIGSYRLVDRPDRVEPRAIKRGPQPYPRLRQTREKARQRACAAAQRKAQQRRGPQGQ